MCVDGAYRREVAWLCIQLPVDGSRGSGSVVVN